MLSRRYRFHHTSFKSSTTTKKKVTHQEEKLNLEDQIIKLKALEDDMRDLRHQALSMVEKMIEQRDNDLAKKFNLMFNIADNHRNLINPNTLSEFKTRVTQQACENVFNELKNQLPHDAKDYLKAGCFGFFNSVLPSSILAFPVFYEGSICLSMLGCLPASFILLSSTLPPVPIVFIISFTSIGTLFGICCEVHDAHERIAHHRARIGDLPEDIQDFQNAFNRVFSKDPFLPEQLNQMEQLDKQIKEIEKQLTDLRAKVDEQSHEDKLSTSIVSAR